MLDRRREYRPHIFGRPGTKQTPPKTGIKNEPWQEGSHETPDDAGNQVVAWHRNIEAEEKGGIGKRKSTTGDIVKGPPNSLLILQGVRRVYVLVYKLSMEGS